MSPFPPLCHLLSFMTFVKFTSSVRSQISLPLGFVLSEKRLCALHTNLHCSESAFARSTVVVLGAVVYMSCPQLASQLVVFTCLSRKGSAATCHTSSECAEQQSRRCCQSFFVVRLDA